MRPNACIFDLDGVIVDTAKYHFLSWQRLANELNIDFTEEHNKELKGVSRLGSLDFILDLGDLKLESAEKHELAEKKNAWYLEYIEEMTEEEILPGSIEFLDKLRLSGVKIALGSGSKNARMILAKIGLLAKFDLIVDGTDVINGKPDPEVFLKAAKGLSVQASHSIVFEDAYKGVQAALAGGFYTVGIGLQEDLQNAHVVFPSLKEIDVDSLSALLSNKTKKLKAKF